MNYNLTDLIDISQLKKLTASFYAIAGLGMAILDTDGAILVQYGWQPICTDFHRVCPQTAQRCKESDLYINNHLYDAPYISYTCQNGLIDFAAPIIVDSYHLGSVFTGQFLSSPPDYQYFRQQAQEFGFDETKYLQALELVPVIPKDHIEQIMRFYTQLAQLLASMGLERMRQLEAWKTIKMQEERLRIVLEEGHDGYWEWDLETGGAYFSSRMVDMLGYKPGEILPLISSWESLVHPDDRAETMNNMHKHMFDSIERYASEYRMLTKSGEWKWIQGRGKIVARNENGQVIRVAGTHIDITERKKFEHALAESNNCFAAVMDSLQDSVMVIDIDNYEIIFANNRMLTRYGKNLIGQKCWNALRNRVNPCPVCLVNKHLKKLDATTGVYVWEKFVKSTHSWIEGRSSFIKWTDGRIVRLDVISDITERKRANEQLKHLSLHNHLTGLYNRFYFEQEMNRLEQFQLTPTAIIICDIDGLKLVNDTLGHSIGDNLLRKSAKIIQSCFAQDTVIARIGGDEFAILLSPCERNSVEQACRKIKESVAVYNSLNQGPPLSLSIGFAFRDKLPLNMNRLFGEADNNMYREKLHSHRSAHSALINTLMKALEERDFITGGHVNRLQDLVASLATVLNFPESSINELRLLAQFHDIGKVGISDRILFKNGPLNDEEFAEMKRHSEIGHRIAQTAPELIPIADWILKHHEWWNGQGYPLGLKGTEIPLECRILSIADAYDAMTSDRPYRKALSSDEAIDELKKCAGIQFDPNLVDKFSKVLKNKN